MTSQTLQYYMHDGPSTFRFELAGDINNEGARELAQAWRTASSMIGDRTLVIDMTFVTGVGEEGRSLLAHWHAEGARLIARTKVSRELAEAITGAPLSEITPDGNIRRERTWLPFHAFFGGAKQHAVSPADAGKMSNSFGTAQAQDLCIHGSSMPSAVDRGLRYRK